MMCRWCRLIEHLEKCKSVAWHWKHEIIVMSYQQTNLQKSCFLSPLIKYLIRFRNTLSHHSTSFLTSQESFSLLITHIRAFTGAINLFNSKAPAIIKLSDPPLPSLLLAWHQRLPVWAFSFYGTEPKESRPGFLPFLLFSALTQNIKATEQRSKVDKDKIMKGKKLQKRGGDEWTCSTLRKIIVLQKALVLQGAMSRTSGSLQTLCERLKVLHVYWTYLVVGRAAAHSTNCFPNPKYVDPSDKQSRTLQNIKRHHLRVRNAASSDNSSFILHPTTNCLVAALCIINRLGVLACSCVRVHTF